MTPSDKHKNLGTSREFATSLGLFYINWAKTELIVDFAIGKSSKYLRSKLTS
jgi:hypothetical protein